MRAWGIAALALLVLGAGPFTCEPARDMDGKIARSAAAVREFRATHPCPATRSIHGACPGWVVDHVIPLCACGPDDPSNMIWQRASEAARKDSWERRLCVHLHTAPEGDQEH